MIPHLARSTALMGLSPATRGIWTAGSVRRAVRAVQRFRTYRGVSTSTRRSISPTAGLNVSTAPPPNTSTAPAPISPEEAAPPAPAPTSFIDRLPTWAAPAKPYLRLLRLDKPIGAVLLYWPCAWSITMAATATHAPLTTGLWYLGLFGVGAFVMRGAGCIINDMWDSRMDAAVERTKTRPIAAGEVSHTSALVFLSTQMALGLAILTQLNTYSILLGAASLPLVVIYPFMKRVTYYPQVVLGMCFEWGALLGWAAMTGALDWAVCAPLYIGSALYCVAYDTIYAHQDKLDDVNVGVKSTALAWGNNSKPIIASLYATFIGGLTLAGHAMGAGPLYYAISCLGGAAQLAWQVITVDLDSRPDCWQKFSSNGYVAGPIIWAGMAADYVHQVLLPLIG